MIIYTDHAEERIARRLLKKSWVEEVVTAPDQVIDVNYGRKQAIKKIGDDEISVVYVKEARNLVVITVFWGR